MAILATILSVVFALYVSHSLYGIWQLFQVPVCEPNQKCYPYFLTRMKLNDEKFELKLLFYTSLEYQPHYDGLEYVGKIEHFNYEVALDAPLNVSIPVQTRRNGSLHLHGFLLPRNVAETNPRRIHSSILSSFSYPLTQYQVPTLSAFDLLNGETRESSHLPVTHIKKAVFFKILSGINELPQNAEIPELNHFVRIDDKGVLRPIMHYDSLSDTLSNLLPLQGNKTVEIMLKYSPVSLGKFRFMVLSEMAFKSIKDFGFSDKDLDQLKSLFNDGNKIYLLCVTLIVASLHLVFDILALKNDVNFWRTRKTLAGLSKKTVMWRAFSQTIVFLFLYEENSSILIIVPSFFGLLIELWKVLKVLRVDLSKMSQNRPMSETEKVTDSIDNQGMKYLLYILFPLCICGALYSLLYNQHKSWYSWTISSLVNGVYAFGFLFMLPQLFINYKMKSVAQLPWRSFMYKAFNTFVDDLFAFIIEMPTAHRLACFRDDLVFVVYLYQRWLYPVDKNRIDDAASVMDELSTDVRLAAGDSKKDK